MSSSGTTSVWIGISLAPTLTEMLTTTSSARPPRCRQMVNTSWLVPPTTMPGERPPAKPASTAGTATSTLGSKWVFLFLGLASQRRQAHPSQLQQMAGGLPLGPPATQCWELVTPSGSMTGTEINHCGSRLGPRSPVAATATSSGHLPLSPATADSLRLARRPLVGAETRRVTSDSLSPQRHWLSA